MLAQVAAYPVTTLEPHLGVVSWNDYRQVVPQTKQQRPTARWKLQHARPHPQSPSLSTPKHPKAHPKRLLPQLKFADIPGLIRGASENRGLGHRFLR